MPIRFSVSPFGRLVIYRVEGVPTTDEVRAFLDEVLSHRKFRRGYVFVGEAPGADIPHAAFTAGIAREVRSRAQSLAPCRWAVIVPSEAGLDLVTRRAAALDGCGVEVAAFLTADEATNWLGTVSRPPARGPGGTPPEDRDDSPSPHLSPVGTP